MPPDRGVRSCSISGFGRHYTLGGTLIGRTLCILLVFGSLIAACGNGSPTNDGSGPSTDYDRDCRIRFGIVSNEKFATLEFQVDYSRVGGEFVGLGIDVECTRIDERVAAWASNWNCAPGDDCYSDETETLYVNVFAGRDISAPLDVLECRFAGDGVPDAADFRFEDVYATVKGSADVEPPPTPAIIGIDCDAPSPTTTSTTLPDPCSDIACDPGEACTAGECVPAVAYEVDIAFDTPVELGALQFDVVHDCREGTFDGERGGVLCTRNPVVNANTAFNDVPCDASGTGHLRAAFVAQLGFEGPIRLATCRYTSAINTPPTPEQFDVVVEDASSPDISPVSGVRVSISAIRAIAD